MKVGPPIVRARRTLFIISTAYDAHTVATYRHSGWPAASIPATFFFQRVWMIRFTAPGGLNVVWAPNGVSPDSWMSVLAYDSLSYSKMRELYSRCVSVAEIAPRPMSAPPPSLQKAITLIGSAFILPFFINALSPAAVPRAAEPEEPSWVCIHGTTHGVV